MRVLFLCVGVLLSTWACGSPPIDGKMMGTEGGTLESSGASVNIPQGALTKDTTIVIAKTSGATAPPPSGVTLSGDAFSFTPHGTTFSKPITITIPYTGTATQVLRLENNSDTTWEVVPGATFSNGKATFTTLTFSVYAPASGGATDGGTSDGSPTESTTENTTNDAGPTDSTPTDSTPTDSTPTDTTPTDSTTNDSTPTDSTPNDTPPTDGGPADTGTDSGPTDTTPSDAGTPDGSTDCKAFCDFRASLNCPSEQPKADCVSECENSPIKPGSNCYAEFKAWGDCLLADLKNTYSCRDGKSQPKKTACPTERSALEKCAGITLP